MIKGMWFRRSESVRQRAKVPLRALMVGFHRQNAAKLGNRPLPIARQLVRPAKLVCDGRRIGKLASVRLEHDRGVRDAM